MAATKVIAGYQSNAWFNTLTSSRYETVTRGFSLASSFRLARQQKGMIRAWGPVFR